MPIHSEHPRRYNALFYAAITGVFATAAAFLFKVGAPNGWYLGFIWNSTNAQIAGAFANGFGLLFAISAAFVLTLALSCALAAMRVRANQPTASLHSKENTASLSSPCEQSVSQRVLAACLPSFLPTISGSNPFANMADHRISFPCVQKPSSTAPTKKNGQLKGSRNC